MSDVLEFPHRPYDDEPTGPTGPVIGDIHGESEQLVDVLSSFPFGSTNDPRAGVSPRTLIELRVAAWALRLVRTLVQRASAREAQYSIENGWPTPD